MEKIIFKKSKFRVEADTYCRTKVSTDMSVPRGGELLHLWVEPDASFLSKVISKVRKK